MHPYSRYRTSAFIAVIMLLVAQPAFALKLALVFNDHMVLQRDHIVPVWGNAKPGSEVIVNLDAAKQTIRAGTDGYWRADFPARPASAKPIVIKITGDGETIIINDVLVGDVWFCSGQSNLGVTVSGASGATEELRKANHPNLRLLTFPSGASWVQGDRPSWWTKEQNYPKWNVCTPATAGAFTAVGYVFGTELLGKLNIPVGIINSAFGGAFIEPFIPREVIQQSGKFPKAQETLKRVEKITDEEMRTLEIQNQQWNDDRKLASQLTKGADAGWQRPGFDDSKWETMPMPGFWQETIKLMIDGSVWFRKTINLDAQQAESDRFSFGYLRMQAKVWVNGKEVSVAPGSAGLSSITYAVPPGILKTGANTIAFRIYSTYGVGGLKRINKEDFSLQQSNKPGKVLVDLAGHWRYQIEMGIPQAPMPLRRGRTDFTVPGVIWNAMIAPFTPFPVRGIIWYQGESNVSRADEYAELLPLLINTWRSEWKDSTLPFLIVQLPNYMPRVAEPGESDWAKLRAAQDRALALPQTAMAVTYDVGEESELHPRNKRTVGERLALLAENMVYELIKSEQARSPRAINARRRGNTVEIRFEPAVKLRTKDGKPPREIAIAGADGKFVWAKAKVKGNTLYISTGNVSDPKRIRHAWANNPDANLISHSGLPVAPFDIPVL